ncbi:MAG TPA: tetratricopeptide repeat protein [Candidatus Binataceae bacterium]|jgi:TPR repeat protein|nr:tetratricopeptide repeat protein [Candidatus Binataceae bacterium]
MQLSQDDQRAILGLIWSLKPSDLSVLQMYLQEAGEAQIGTAKDSGNDIFYSHLERLGLAREVPLGLDSPPQAPQAFEQLKTFTLTEPGKAELLTLIEGARKNGYPAPDSIVSPEAIRMLKQYAAQGDALSQGKLGLLYETGAGVQQDPAEALKWYQKAADQGDQTAHCNIGVMYFSGAGVPKDIDEAIKWFRKGADLGSALAMNNLGEVYSRALGVAQDYPEAFKWYRKAAHLGHAPAMYKLALLYGTGRGAPRDNVQAYM